MQWCEIIQFKMFYSKCSNKAQSGWPEMFVKKFKDLKNIKSYLYTKFTPMQENKYSDISWFAA